MEFKSEQKHILISPRKARPVADLIRKMSPIEALEKLPFIRKRSSEVILKVLKSAVNNATQRGIDTARLVIKEIIINEGPRLKRGQPVSRGRWHAIKKRMSHIRVVLQTTKTVEAQNLKPKKKRKEIKKNESKN